MTEKKYTWFIEPLDDRTNLIISQELPEQNASRGVTCEDGEKHNLWQCSYILAYMFAKSKIGLNLRLKIYNKKSHQGKIRQCDFLFSKPRKKKKQKTAK